MQSQRTTWEIDLPYPKPPLGLNQRMHWAALYRLKKQLRSDAFKLARSVKLPRGLARVEIVLHWQPSVHRPRDSDNPTLTLKPLIDGLTDYGLTADDDSAHVESRCVIEPVARPARVWLTIRDMDAAVTGEQTAHEGRLRSGSETY